MDEDPWKRYRVGVVALLLVAFALRLFALDGRPLWWDEGLTLTYAYLAPGPNLALAVRTEHLNPPLSNWLVGAQTALVGVTVFSTRLASVWGGMLVAAATVALARRAAGRAAALLALLLVALAPMQIYHAQEAKGYTVETAALLVAAFCWLRLHAWALRRPRSGGRQVTVAAWPWWAGYAAATLLAMGTNYLALFALVALNLHTVALTLRARRQGVAWPALRAHWLRWLAVQAAGLLPLVPYVVGSLGSSSRGLELTSVGLETRAPAGYLWEFLRTFVASERPGGAVGEWLTALVVLLAAGGLLARAPARWRAARMRAMRWLVAGWLALPLLFGYLFHARFAWFFPRYLLYIQPALLLLAAVGLARLWQSRLRLGAAALLAALVLLSVPILRNHYTRPAASVEDEDWRQLIQAMRPYVREGDGAIVRTSWMPGYMRAYLPPAPQPEWILGFFDEATIDQTLEGFLARHERVWQLDYQMDPFNEHNDSAVWMRGKAAIAYTEQIGAATATLFVSGDSLQAGAAGAEQASAFENGVHVQWAPHNGEAAPGEVVGLRATWWTEQPLAARLVRFLHVMNGDGMLVAQVDREPVAGASRSYEWGVGERVVDPIALVLPPDLPAGRYRLQLGLYDRDTLERVPLVGGGDYVVVGEIEVR